MGALAILAAIENAAAMAKIAKNVVEGLTGHAIGLAAQPAPGGGTIAITADMVHAAVARGEARVDALEATSDSILDRLRLEGKLPK